MAAQPLVRGPTTPIETFATNVIGTANLLEAARQTGTVEAIVNVTTDKCYETENGCGLIERTIAWVDMTHTLAARPVPSWWQQLTEIHFLQMLISSLPAFVLAM